MTVGPDAEKLGTARKVQAEFGLKSGYFLKHRVEHVDGRKIAYLIDEDNFGISRLLSRPGFSLELDPKGRSGNACHLLVLPRSKRLQGTDHESANQAPATA